MTKPAMDLVRESLSECIEWLCSHDEIAKSSFELNKDKTRFWCGQCHNWVYLRDLGVYERAREALSKLPKVKTREEFYAWWKANTLKHPDFSLPAAPDEIYDFLVGSDD